MKKKSSKWVKGKGEKYNSFYWQNGYGAFSIGKSQVETLKKYIFNQHKHHQKRSFKEEYRDILTKYGLDFDERYIWSD